MIRKLLFVLLLFLSTSFSLKAQQVADPDPLRFSQEIETFQQWDAKNSFPENSVLFVGSSSIRFWKTHQAFPEMPVINRGFGGAHISDVQYYYKQVIGKYSPSVIVFYAGDNDIAAGKSVEQVMDDYQQITDRILKDYPEVKFIYIPIKPSSSRWNYWPNMSDANRGIREFNRQREQLYYLDLATPLLKNGTPNDDLFMDDLLHLNEKGYAKWNGIMKPALRDLLKNN